MKITVPAEPGDEPLDCAHQYVGLCESCRTDLTGKPVNFRAGLTP